MIKPVVKDHRWDDCPDKFWHLFSVKMGDAKTYFGAVNNSIVYYVRDVVSYALEHHKDWRVKQKVKYIWRWLSMLEYRVKTHPLGYFVPENFSKSKRQSFNDDVNVDKLYDNWVMQAGEGYVMLSKAAKVFQHRCKLILRDWHCPDPETIAYLTTAQWMLNCQTDMFEHWTTDLSEILGITEDSCRTQLSCFTLEGLRDAVEKLMYTIYPEAETRVASELEQHQMTLAWESIDKVFGSTDFIFKGSMSAIEEDDVIYKTKGYKKKMLKAMSECRQTFDEELQKHKITQ